MNALILAAARLCPCPHCWQQPELACTPLGDHLARFQRAERKGLILRDELVAVVAGLEVIAGGVVVTAVPLGRAA